MATGTNFSRLAAQHLFTQITVPHYQQQCQYLKAAADSPEASAVRPQFNAMSNGNRATDGYGSLVAYFNFQVCISLL